MISLITLFFVLFITCLAQNQEVYLRTHSLQPPFLDSDLQNRYWEFGGHTVVSTNKYVRLTPDRQSKKGWLWSKDPLPYENFIVEFEFKVDGQGSRVYGDGFAVWFTQEKEQTGPVFGNTQNFHGLGIFFDTFANGKHKYAHPYVSAMVSDGSTYYSHDDDNERFNAGGCHARFRQIPYPTRARIKYVNGGLMVQLDVEGRESWNDCFFANVNLPNNVYIGFTAMTGDVADNHDILKVSSYGIVSPKPAIFNQPAPDQGNVHQPKTGRRGESFKSSSKSDGIGVMGWILVVLAIIAIIGLIFYFSTQKRSSKRF